MSVIAEKQTTKYQLYRTLWKAVDWLFPPYCGGCGSFGSRWCQQCANSVTVLGENVCQVCGEPQSSPGICPVCLASPPPFSACRSWAAFEGPLREAIHHLKYQHDLGLGEPLASALSDMLSNLNWNIDLIVPVPLSAERFEERGYNHSTYIARPVAYACNTKFSTRALQRTRNTPTQVGLNAQQRKNNVSGAFHANCSQVENRTILVIDDVATTGATLSACSQALFEAGAKEVYGLTLARAIIHQDGR